MNNIEISFLFPMGLWKENIFREDQEMSLVFPITNCSKYLYLIVRSIYTFIFTGKKKALAHNSCSVSLLRIVALFVSSDRDFSILPQID